MELRPVIPMASVSPLQKNGKQRVVFSTTAVCIIFLMLCIIPHLQVASNFNQLCLANFQLYLIFIFRKITHFVHSLVILLTHFQPIVGSSKGLQRSEPLPPYNGSHLSFENIISFSFSSRTFPLWSGPFLFPRKILLPVRSPLPAKSTVFNENTVIILESCPIG